VTFEGVTWYWTEPYKCQLQGLEECLQGSYFKASWCT